jgi:hypothetical protein
LETRQSKRTGFEIVKRMRGKILENLIQINFTMLRMGCVSGIVLHISGITDLDLGEGFVKVHFTDIQKPENKI